MYSGRMVSTNEKRNDAVGGISSVLIFILGGVIGIIMFYILEYNGKEEPTLPVYFLSLWIIGVITGTLLFKKLKSMFRHPRNILK